MTKKTPWWRKPYDEDDDEQENEKEKSKKDRSKSYDRRPEDWRPQRHRSFESPFDDDFDRFFSRSPFGLRDDLSMDVEREFEEMHERMDKVFKHAMDGKLEKPNSGGPFVYGFSMRTGPDGIPHIQQFGNMSPEMLRRFGTTGALPLRGSGEIGSTSGLNERPNKAVGLEINRREPLTDIIEHDKHFTITMELPGIEKKDIDLNIINNELEVLVDNPERKYYKKLPLPSEVDPEIISANFKNGVLDVSVKRLKPLQGKKIKID